MPQVEAQVRKLGGVTGVKGCALVEIESGMVWHSAGGMADFDRFSEAACEFWRLHGRLSANLQVMGEPQLALFAFSESWLALAPCGKTPALIVVAVTEKQGIDWKAWNREIADLQVLLRSP